MRVGLAASDQDIDPSPGETRGLAIARRYVARISEMKRAGATVIVLPEKFVGVTPADSDHVIGILSDAARAQHVTVVAGLNRFQVSPRRNVAVVIGPDGAMVVEYEKKHLVPVIEAGYGIGSMPRFFVAADTAWGVL
jgi:predicted amidohydrolase